MRPIVLSQQAQEHLAERGVTFSEIETTIREGESVPAKKGRKAFRKNFPFESHWKGKYYEGKQVMPIVIEEPDRYIVVTVYVFYIGGKP